MYSCSSTDVLMTILQPEQCLYRTLKPAENTFLWRPRPCSSFARRKLLQAIHHGSSRGAGMADPWITSKSLGNGSESGQASTMCGCTICGTHTRRLLPWPVRASPKSERSSVTASLRRQSDTLISLIVRLQRLLPQSVHRSFHFRNRRRVTMPVPEEDAALVMLKEASIEIGRAHV